ncbi:hypothetical protein HS088_TW14G00833 [Tripterygium wilfordii]|uniref:BLISTER n=1 Tax=Tripterygium wilfordii TaxID=458696 RepID=A0A7J7CRF3_TRIWF|nr:protein BLISTER [Tripterygium wilfordii]XP_038723058.1 protein BLISTER [Tripterygium wilfordii]KAF5736683.1 hypothetical protein HS088_TW14G00833 [Tripterygium wilfordii]
MASAQVLPTSRKQEHLEAGKKKLEEFRKKKAAERAKKYASTSQRYTSDVSIVQKQFLEAERVTHSDGADTSEGPRTFVEGFGVDMNNGIKALGLDQKSEQSYLKDTDDNVSFMTDHSSSLVEVAPTHANNLDFQKFDASEPTETVGVQEIKDTTNDIGYYNGAPKGPLKYGIFSTYSQSTGMESSQSKENKSYMKDSAASLSGSPYSNFTTSVSASNSGSFQMPTKPSFTGLLAVGSTSPSYYEDSIQPTSSSRVSMTEVVEDVHGAAKSNDHMDSDLDERKRSSFASGSSSMHGANIQTSDSTGFDSDVRGSLNHEPRHSTSTEGNSRRSRPSFLDSLNVPRASAGTNFQKEEFDKDSFLTSNSNVIGVDNFGVSANSKLSKESETMGPFSKPKYSNMASAFEHATKFSVPTSNGVDVLKPSVNEKTLEKNHGFYSPKQDEDFAALEQHIEDLTHEKFSLQRALEASRVLAESLASENSSLTDSYNQQRSFVNLLKSDMEKLQDEIKVIVAELESVKMEYANAQLECNAADERAKLLASEVIGLEEKALKLRSSELKLARQLENSEAEISSYKKKMSSQEKERQDLQSTIDALQEEKKLLQSKLRKASGGKSTDVSKGSTQRKDIATTTEDLETSNQETQGPSNVGSEAEGLPLLHEHGLLDLEASSTHIPPDQMRMIQNINALISELALEKEELTQALASESSQCSKLKDLNKELSRKLEAQTQRLELLTAKSMAKENIPARLPDSRTIQENTPYADEGDEVVERVLGWLMKLFPGGPSRRRPNKLL